MTSWRLTLGLGVIYMAVSTLSPLLLKTTPSDLDLYFWPSAETAVSGHPLLIYSAHLHDSYPNANGPLGLLPLIPMAALANALGWAGSLHGRAAVTGAVVSLLVLLLAFLVVRAVTAARGSLRWPLAVACLVLLAPALWIAVIDYGHIEQPLELCLILLAAHASLHNRHAVTGVALGAAILTRTIAGLCLIPFLLLPLATRRMRPMAVTVLAAAITIGIGLAPFLIADGHAVTHSLLTYRGILPIGGGSFWVVARHASWVGLIRSGDVYLAAAVACALVAYTLRRNPAVATTNAGLMGLLTIASCCFPLLAKTVFPYYLLEPYLFSVIWWLARNGSVRTGRAMVPSLLTIDVLVVKAASASPFSTVGALASVAASALVLVAMVLVILDLLHAPWAQGVPGMRNETPSRTVSAEYPRGLSVPRFLQHPFALDTKPRTCTSEPEYARHEGSRRIRRPRWFAAGVLFAVTACSPVALQVASPSVSPVPEPSASATPYPSPSLLPPVSRLPGASFALPALPPGVPFTGKLLIADRGNGRIIEINARGQVDWMFPRPGQSLPVRFGAPDDAFYTADGTTIIANAESRQTVTAIDRATGTILWQVGRYDVRSSAVGYFNEPDDAVPQPDGTIWVADIRNCRLVHLSAAGVWLGTLGNRACLHNPPSSFADPNGAFPTLGGALIVTEIGGRWVTSLVPGGAVAWSVRAPVRYPSDAMQLPGASILLTDYSLPGAVARLSDTGRTLWYYRPSGTAELNHTSIAIPLASNRIAICDDFHSRIVVVDPATNQVVWTFTGTGASRLFYPDGIDYEPPQ